MNGVAPGTVLVARYRLDAPLPSDLADVTAWSANDQILDRTVRVSLVSGRFVAEALDSARRAALVADPRLTRVLDVGSEDGVAYIVTEPFAGVTLSEVVAGGIIDPQQARALVGEAAAALESARRRGVHHLALRPDCVRVDGSRVVVTGLGLDAGLADQDQRDPVRTSRADAVGLVALLYYAMTARWAGPALDVPWIDDQAIHPLPAQRDGSDVVRLSNVRYDVPEDLDELCAQTFRPVAGEAEDWTRDLSGDGPRNPADVVTALEPWGEVSVVAAIPPFVPAASAGVNRQSVRSAFDMGAASPPGTPPPAPPVRRPSTGRIHRVGPATGAVAAAGAAGYAGAATAQTAPVGLEGTTATMPAQAPAAAPASYAAANGVEQTQETWSEPAGGAPAGPPPVAPPPRRGPRRFNATPFVIVLALILVGYGVWWAVNTAFEGFEPPLQAEQQTAAPEEGTEEPAEGGEGAEEPAEPEPEPEVRPVIAQGTALDPEGDALGDNDGEHPDEAPRAYDGQPETFWSSRRYNTAQFAGLKNGIGYAVALEEKASVTTIILDTTVQGGNVEIRATSADSPTKGDVLASGPLSPGVEFALPEAVETDSIVLWFTELPQNQAGENRVELNEILVS
ncbi:protein kinase family protein [Cellulosimicrobium terreum]|nr:protein kinase family protein [Cellulosimicrobium terreum]